MILRGPEPPWRSSGIMFPGLRELRGGGLSGVSVSVHALLFLAFWWGEIRGTTARLGESRQIDKAIGFLHHTGLSPFIRVPFSFFFVGGEGGTHPTPSPEAREGRGGGLPRSDPSCRVHTPRALAPSS